VEIFLVLMLRLALRPAGLYQESRPARAATQKDQKSPPTQEGGVWWGWGFVNVISRGQFREELRVVLDYEIEIHVHWINLWFFVSVIHFYN
jgi:hypothetical protein